MDELRVLQLTRYDRLGGSSRLRFYDYAPLLAQQGIAVTPAPFFDDAYLERRYAGKRQPIMQILSYYRQRLGDLLSKNRYDLVWLEKEALPWLPAILELPLLRGVPFAIDFDDAWFHRYDQHPNPAVRRLLQSKFPALIRKAAVVMAGSPYLAEWASNWGAQKIVRLPTTVDLTRYQTRQPNHGSEFVIGWMGSPSTASYLQAIEQALKDVAGATIRLIGAGLPELPIPYQQAPWNEATETTDLTGFDVGIMPLPSDAWSEGKCAYKLIQYMATGLPVVASPVGMNREVVQHGINGFLASDQSEWMRALTTLRDDPALRQRMGAAGRKLVEEKYTLTGNADLLALTLRNAAAGNSQE